jgi:methionyl-tRNA formyltransferase
LLRFELIAAISWRLLITPRELAAAPLGGVNLHRGRLPEYPGGSPLHRALENRDSSVGLTAHCLSPEIDAGEILEIVEHPVDYDGGLDIDDHVERLKQEISPLFGPLLIRALTACVERNE